MSVCKNICEEYVSKVSSTKSPNQNIFVKKLDVGKFDKSGKAKENDLNDNDCIQTSNQENNQPEENTSDKFENIEIERDKTIKMPVIPKLDINPTITKKRIPSMDYSTSEQNNQNKVKESTKMFNDSVFKKSPFSRRNDVYFPNNIDKR